MTELQADAIDELLARAVVYRSASIGLQAPPDDRLSQLAARAGFPILAAALRRLAGWNWPPDKVKEAWPLLCSSDVEAFLRKYGGDDR
jgi:hypothetical protein